MLKQIKSVEKIKALGAVWNHIAYVYKGFNLYPDEIGKVHNVVLCDDFNDCLIANDGTHYHKDLFEDVVKHKRNLPDWW